MSNILLRLASAGLVCAAAVSAQSGALVVHGSPRSNQEGIGPWTDDDTLEELIGELELDQILHLSDLPVPAGVEIPELVGGNDLPVVTVHVIKAAAEPEAGEADEAAEGEAPPAGEESGGEGEQS